jgi:hypothetical protein
LKYQTTESSKRVKDSLPEFVDGKGWGGVQGTGVQEFRSSGVREFGSHGMCTATKLNLMQIEKGRRQNSDFSDGGF